MSTEKKLVSPCVTVSDHILWQSNKTSVNCELWGSQERNWRQCIVMLNCDFASGILWCYILAETKHDWGLFVVKELVDSWFELGLTFSFLFFSFAFIAFWAFMYLLCSAIFKSLSVVKRNTKLSYPNNYSELCWRCNLHQACETAGKGGKARVSQGMFWFGIVADWLVREQYRTFSSQLDVSRAVLNWVWKGIRHLLRFCFYYDLRLAK